LPSIALIFPWCGAIISTTAFSASNAFFTVVNDAVYVPGGKNSIAALKAEPDALHFLNEAFKHCKAIAADAEGMQVLQATNFSNKLPAHDDADGGVITGSDLKKLSGGFIKAIAQHRFWEREKARKVPA
jgi:catalase